MGKGMGAVVVGVIGVSVGCTDSVVGVVGVVAVVFVGSVVRVVLGSLVERGETYVRGTQV
jgi:hypothetical protein